MNSRDLHTAKQAVIKGLLKPNQLAHCLQYQKNELEKGNEFSLSDIFVQVGYITKKKWKSLETDVYGSDDFSVDTPQTNIPTVALQNIPEDDFSLDGTKNSTETNEVEKSIGRYDILGVLGSGAMGRVYKAYDSVLERVVALKVLLREDNDTQIERFLREAKATAKLGHPNIVTLYDTGITEGKHYFTMDYIEGDTLEEYAKKQAPSIKQIINILISVGEGIHFAHQNDIIHRDLKPANIMIDKNEKPIVMDFGLAKVFNDSKKLSRTGTIVGTLHYMAPEQAKGRIREIDSRSDVYSLGAILYKLISGRPPLTSNTFLDLVEKIIQKEPLPLKKVKRKIHTDVNTICMKALMKNKEDRYQSVLAMIDDFKRYLQGEPIQAKMPSFFDRTRQRVKHFKTYITPKLLVPISLLVVLFGIWRIREQKTIEKLNAISNKTKKMLKKVDLAEEITRKYILDNSIPETIHNNIEKSLEKLLEIRTFLDKARNIAPRNEALKKQLYFIEKEIGLLALLQENYMMSLLAFSRCKSLMKTPEIIALIKKTKEQKISKIHTYSEKLMNILVALEKSPTQEIFDEYTTQVIHMRSIFLVKIMIRLLKSKYTWQRILAIRVLGKMKDRSTKFDGKIISQHLIEHFMKTDASHNQEVVELIWAIGRLKDRSASHLIFFLRLHLADRAFLNRTDIPYNWIPVEQKEIPLHDKTFSHTVTLVQSGKFKEAGVLLPSILRRYPYSSKVLFYRARCYYEMRDFNRALQCYNRAIKLNPKMTKAYNDRGNTFQQLGFFQQAINNHNKAIELNPNWDLSYNLRGTAYYKQGKFVNALADLSKALKLNPKNALARTHRGVVFHHLGKFNQAINDFTIAIKLNPQYRPNYSFRANTFLKLKKFKSAFPDFQMAVKLDPKNSEVYNSRANYWASKKRYDRALFDLKIAISLNPNNFEAYNNKGAYWMIKGNLKEALKEYSKALEINPSYIQGYVNRSLVYIKLQDWQSAINDFSKILQFNPKDLMAYRERAFCYQKLKKIQNAVHDWNMYIKLSPNAKDIPHIKTLIQQYSKK